MLQTPRLTLRPHRNEDASSLVELNRDPEVVRFTGDKPFFSLPDAQALIQEQLLPQYQLHRMGRFAVFLQDGSYIGWCGLKTWENGDVDLGYRLMKRYWGLGLATEAAKACLDYGFRTLKLKRIIARTMPDNRASIKVIQKLGMTFKGLVSDPCDPHSYIVYELTEARYRACAG